MKRFVQLWVALTVVSFTAAGSHEIKKVSTSSFKSLAAMAENSVKRYGKRNMFGHKVSEKKYEWMTYKQFGEQVEHVRAGLSALGVTKGDSIAIVGKNSAKWAVTAYAGLGLGAAIVPMYLEQPADEWVYKIQNSDAKIVVVDDSQILTSLMIELAKVPKVEMPSFQKFVLLNDESNAENVVTFATLLATKERLKAAEIDETSVATIIYTSGTTGVPKGVVLQQKHLMGMLNGLAVAIKEISGEQSLSFLTWGHIFGQLAELHALILYGNSTVFNVDKKEIPKELMETKPTVLFSVPSMFKKLKDAVDAEVKKDPKKQEAYERFQRYKAKRAAGKKIISPLDWAAARMFQHKVKARFGGRLKYAVNGGGKLDKDVAIFMKDVGFVILDGYGMSESGGIISLNTPKNNRIGSVGRPFPGLEIKIDESVQRIEGEGEILVRRADGSRVMAGYHKMPEATEATFTSDNFLRTGDIGKIVDGYVYITGRIKEIYKLTNGRYITPSVFENQVTRNPYFTDALLFGAEHDYNVALLIVSKTKLEELATKLGVAPSLEDPSILKVLDAEYEQASAGLKLEQAKYKKYLTDEWTVENGMKTPLLKLKRSVVEAKYKEILEEMYR